MAIRTRINFLLILLMLGAQLALAQHATVHFTDHVHQSSGAGQHEPDGPTPAAHEQCQICVLTKNLAHALASGESHVVAGSVRQSFILPGTGHFTRQLTAAAYLARGPPAFLS